MTNAQKNEAVRLFEEGKTYREIGSLIGTTPESVKQLFYRRRKKPLTIICEQCHQPIKSHSNRQHRFCSDLCRTRWWSHHPEEFSNKEQHSFSCKVCSKNFYSRRNTAFFCSRNCYYESRNQEVMNVG